MPTTSEAGQAERSAETTHAVYVYGIVPADVAVTDTAAGVGDPPARVRLVRYRGIAALASDVDTSQPLGRPEDLLAHEQLLDGSAGEAPVLPFRFGAVLQTDQAVEDELLAPYHDGFAAQLAEFEGRIQFVAKGRYREQAILREVLTEYPGAAEIRDQLAGRPEADPATRGLRIRLGEIINAAIDQKRTADTRRLGDVIAACCEASQVRQPSHELDAVHVALLVVGGRVVDLDQALGALAREWADRVELRLLGPMAAYDFVSAHTPGG
ncbi:MAG TPA: GvpL/GvpF family gas vesicle protein [Streptosporangiaceae bacterium]|nr:GvpL/GvpF family gas vesicle protein [Streptosporangiaceae bacterium]